MHGWPSILNVRSPLATYGIYENMHSNGLLMQVHVAYTNFQLHVCLYENNSTWVLILSVIHLFDAEMSVLVQKPLLITIYGQTVTHWQAKKFTSMSTTFGQERLEQGMTRGKWEIVKQSWKRRLKDARMKKHSLPSLFTFYWENLQSCLLLIHLAILQRQNVHDVKIKGMEGYYKKSSNSYISFLLSSQQCSLLDPSCKFTQFLISLIFL